MTVSFSKRSSRLYVSSKNSSTVALAASATFTGEWEQSPEDGVTVSCLTDAPGTLFFDFSNDGGATTHSTFPDDGFVVNANVHEIHTEKVNGRSFRVRLVNNGTTQTTLSLATYFGPHTQPNTPLNQAMPVDADSIIVRPFDTWVDSELGRLGGVLEDQKFGSVEAVDGPDAPVDVWAIATDTLANRLALKTFPTSAGSFFAASDNAGDTNVKINVAYVDASGSSATIDVDLNGQTAVDTSADGYDVNRVIVTGSVAASGNIYITTSNAFTNGVPDTISDTVAYILAGDGQTQQALYTVPAGKQALIKDVSFDLSRASGALGSATIDLRVREQGGTWVVKRRFFATTGAPEERHLSGLIVPPLANIAIRVTAISDNGTNIACFFTYVLVDA